MSTRWPTLASVVVRQVCAVRPDKLLFDERAEPWRSQCHEPEIAGPVRGCVECVGRAAPVACSEAAGGLAETHRTATGSCLRIHTGC